MEKEIQEKLLEIVGQNYDEIAEEFNVTRQKPLWPELIKFADEVKDGDSVLDVGCGNGRLVAAFAGKNITYLGVDQSEKLIDLAQKRFRDSRLASASDSESRRAGFRFQVGNILELDKITQEKFDLIFCIAVLHHVPGNDLRLKALLEMKKRLEPGGKIILSVWNLWSDEFKFRSLLLRQSLLKMIGLNKYDWGDLVFPWGKNQSQRYYHVFSREGLRNLSKRAGLKVDKIYSDRYNHYLVLRT